MKYYMLIMVWIFRKKDGMISFKLLFLYGIMRFGVWIVKVRFCVFYVLYNEKNIWKFCFYFELYEYDFIYRFYIGLNIIRNKRRLLLLILSRLNLNRN